MSKFLRGHESRIVEIVVDGNSPHLPAGNIYQVLGGTLIWDNGEHKSTVVTLYFECRDTRKTLHYRWCLLRRRVKDIFHKDTKFCNKCGKVKA